MGKQIYFFAFLFTIIPAILFPQTPTLQFTLYGEKAGDLFGVTYPAGDVNRDGYADFLVSSPGGNYVKLFFGGTNFNLSRQVKFQKPRTIPFGEIASGIGDINGDGYDDFAIGSKNYGNATGWMPGKVWIYFGGATIDTAASIEIQGRYFHDTFGTLIKPAGDVNNDGYSDFLISAPYNWSNGKGYAVLVLGGSSINNNNIIILNNDNLSGRFGFSMEGVGDINKDGYDDFVIGSPQGEMVNGKYPGKAYVYYGGNPVSNAPAYIIEEPEESNFGFDIINAGDVNGDGIGDFFITSYASKRLYTSENNYLKIQNSYGPSVCSGLDINKDGKKDFIFGNYQGYNQNGLMTGKLAIVWGSSVLDTIPGCLIYGKYHWEDFGGKICSIGDINSDGYYEFAVCMPNTYPEVFIPDDALNSIGKIEVFSLSEVVGIDQEARMPNEYRLLQNYPNPFNPSTIIEFILPRQEFVKIKVYDLLCREISTVTERHYDAGRHKVFYNSNGLPSGIYLYKLETQLFSETKKMIILK